jgi:hypothetical protein
MPQGKLTDFIEEVTGDSHLRVEDDLGDGFVRLRSAEAERRQAKHDIRGTEDIVIEMLRNARDAHAHSIFVAVSREGERRRLTILDDGDGIPEHMRTRIFEARVTSKLDTMHIDTWGVHGRGMALYAIQVNAETAYVASSKTDGGSSIVVETNTSVLSEKADQSSMPVFSLSENGTVIVRGPRNINRTVSEFAYIDRDICTVYYGSPVEIAATLWDFGRMALSQGTIAFCNDPEELPICKRVALSGTPDEFVRIAASLGVQLSDRSARRIMDGDIQPLAPLADGIDPRKQFSESEPSSPRRETIPPALHCDAGKAVHAKDARGLKVTDDDLGELRQAVARAYEPLAEGYYLDPSVDPEVRVRKDSIIIRIPVRSLR